MIDISLWSNMHETQRLLSRLKKEVDKSKDAITEFGGLIRSKKLEREYCYQVGHIEGIKFILKAIEDMKQESDNETT